MPIPPQRGIQAADPGRTIGRALDGEVIPEPIAREEGHAAVGDERAEGRALADGVREGPGFVGGFELEVGVVDWFPGGG